MEAANSEKETLLRKRRNTVQLEDSDSDNTLPYDGKVFLARKKKPDSWWCFSLEVGAVMFAFGLAYYAYYHFEHLHFHVTNVYAHLGFPNAQHQIGQKYLMGSGVKKEHAAAMEWFRKAANQGHPHASYNLAIGHLRGMKTDLKEGEAKQLIIHAASQGVKEAEQTLNNICFRGGCERRTDKMKEK